MKSRQHISYANVTATLALFVALGGSAYAAAKLPANSVGTKQIRNKAVTSKKLAVGAVETVRLAANAVDGSKLAPNAVDGSKVRDASLTGADIAVSSLPKVPAAILADAAAIVKVQRVSASGQNAAAPAGDVDIKTATASCPAGLVVVGGGASVTDQQAQLVNDSYPSAAGSWTTHVINGGPGTPGFTAWALCAPAATTG